MFAVYNLICDSEEEQIKTAKRLRKEIEEAREMSLEEQCTFFFDFFQSKDLGSKFYDPYTWEYEQEDGTFNAVSCAPWSVSIYFGLIANEQFSYLDSIIQGDGEGLPSTFMKHLHRPRKKRLLRIFYRRLGLPSKDEAEYLKNLIEG